ncbi:exported hypothetical protein [Burkholderiales bacterium 8X]|nr:exported hypothetical protein [Burkholderiales bacterium 8X]
MRRRAALRLPACLQHHAFSTSASGSSQRPESGTDIRKGTLMFRLLKFGAIAWAALKWYRGRKQPTGNSYGPYGRR